MVTSTTAPFNALLSKYMCISYDINASKDISGYTAAEMACARKMYDYVHFETGAFTSTPKFIALTWESAFFSVFGCSSFDRLAHAIPSSVEFIYPRRGENPQSVVNALVGMLMENRAVVDELQARRFAEAVLKTASKI
jgi:hypothetical protein